VDHLINIFKMDLHRFRTNRVVYLLLLVFSAFQIFGIFMIKQYEQPGDGGLSIGTMNESQFMQYMLSQPPSWVLFYIVVFTVYFYMSEYNSRFYRNYITMKNSRLYSVLSKALILALFTLFILIVLMISNIVGKQLFFGHTELGDIGYFAKLLLGQFLLHWSFSVLILCVAVYTRNIVIGLSLGFVFALNVFGMLFSALESLQDQVQFTKYMLVNTIMSHLDYNTEDFIHVIAVSIISLLLFAAVAIRFKRKEDL